MVELAFDVIAQIKLEKLVVERDVYCEVEFNGLGFSINLNRRLRHRRLRQDYICGALNRANEDFEYIKFNEVTNVAKCHVCALGAMFVAAASKRDDVMISDAKVVWTLLEEYTTPSQIVLIEVAFERAVCGVLRNSDAWEVNVNNGHYLHESGEKLSFTKCEDAANMYGYEPSRSSQDVLISIMQNIIENNGEFVVVER